MVSLYDYLGKAAGKELGGLVSAYAVKLKAKIETRKVTNPKYTGEVHLYERAFLDLFFAEHPTAVIGTNR